MDAFELLVSLCDYMKLGIVKGSCGMYIVKGGLTMYGLDGSIPYMTYRKGCKDCSVLHNTAVALLNLINGRTYSMWNGKSTATICFPTFVSLEELLLYLNIRGYMLES